MELEKSVGAHKKILISAGMGLGCGLAAVISPLLLVTLLFLPLPVACCTARYGWAYGGMCAALALLFVFAVGGMAALIVFGVLCLPAFVLISAALKRKTRFFDAAALSITAYAVGVVLLVLGFRLVTGVDVVTFVNRIMEVFAGLYPDLARQLVLVFNMNGIAAGVTDAQAIMALSDARAGAELIKGVNDFLYTTTPMLFAIYTIVGGFCTYLLAHAWARKGGAAVCPIAPFSRWRLPKGSTIGLTAAAVAAFSVGLMPDLPNVEMAAGVLLNGLIIIMVVVGLSFVDFLLRRTRLTKAARVLILVAAGLFLMTMLMLAGIVEQLGNMKKRMLEDSGDGFQ